MKKSILLIILLITLIPFITFAEESKKNPVEVLNTVQCFAFGGTGYGGTISEGEIAFKKVLKGNNPKEVFIKIFKNANPQGKSYALVALHGLDIDIYNKLANEFKDENIEVVVMSGCLVFDQNSKEIVEQISSNKFSTYLE